MQKETSFVLIDFAKKFNKGGFNIKLKYNNKIVFEKIIGEINGNLISRVTRKYNSDYKVQHFDTRSHILSMIYLQLSNTKSLRGVIDKLQNTPKLKRLINVPSLSQLSRKNKNRDCRIFEDIYNETVGIAKRKLGIRKYNESFKDIKIIDSTIIQIAASLAPHLEYDNSKSGMKISTLYSLNQAIPDRVEIVPAKVNDRKCISTLFEDKSALYLFDRGYFDYKLYDQLTDDGKKFITRQINNACVEEIKSHYTGRDLVFDTDITLGTDFSHNKTHNKYREILTFDEDEEEFRVLTNIFDVPADKILELYRLRWEIEVFFKWIKQNLRIKHWLGYNENAIKIQIYTALVAYILLSLFNLAVNRDFSMLKLTRIVEANLLEIINEIEFLSG